jgi:O-antigen ligase/Tfp pilus assembly protein PilF
MKAFFGFLKQYRILTVLLLGYTLFVIFFWNLQMLFPISFIILFKLFKSKISSITISYLDIGFAILFLSEIITSFNSAYSFNSINSFLRLSFIIILYVGYKVFLGTSKQELILLKVIILISTFLAVFTIDDFVSFKDNLKSVGFSSSINFKNLYTPLGNLINAWTSVVLIFIPLNCLFLLKQRNKKWALLVLLNLFLISFCFLSSFSRGAYICLLLSVLIFNILVWSQISLKKIILYNVIAISLLSLVSIPIKEDVLTTLAFNKTESQQRSASTRMSEWQNAKELIKDKPIFGWGQGNFILAQDKVAFQKEDSVFCPRTQNTYINLLVERGFFGFFCYLVFLGIVFWMLIRNYRSKTNSNEDKILISIIASGLLVILLREFTYASIFEFNNVFFMFFCLLFFLIPYDIPLRTIHSEKLKYGVPFLFLAAVATLLYINISKVLVLEQNSNFLKSFYKDDFKSSQVSINKALELAPENISILKNHSLFLLKNSLIVEISEKYPHLLSITAVNKDTLQLASKDLKTILKLNPYDDENLHNLAWVYFALGHPKVAQDLLTKAIKLDAYNSTYHISKVLFDLKQENNSEVKNHLVKALRYSPEVLESIFYKEFSKKYPKLAKESKQIAISDLQTEIRANSNTILKARLARLLLDEDPKKAKQLLEDVTTALPNLSRPWLYLAYLNSQETNDTLKIKRSYEKSLFLNPYDFLSNTYYGNYYMAQHNEKKGLQFFRTSLLSYRAIKSSNYAKNYLFSNIPVSNNSIIPNNLLHYSSPDPQALPIFKAFERYHQINNTKYKDLYSKMVKSYSQQLFKYELELP